MKKMWNQALQLAQLTPEDRNRYMDFLRALAISAVVLGHWIMAAPYLSGGQPYLEHLLSIQPSSQWLTWLFQVMPIFFFVGGYANGVSWDSACASNKTWSQWFEGRMRRMIGPALPLILLWLMLGVAGSLLGISQSVIGTGSQIALVPVWFLAIYLFIVSLVPLTRKAWHQFGFYSVSVPIVLAMLCDWLFFNSSLAWLNWLNYLFIWGAVHQLGFAWQGGRMRHWSTRLLYAIGGLLVLVYLTQYGLYPTSLVGVPGSQISNTTAPKLPLLALAFAQIGLLLLLEKPMRNWLASSRVWATTVLVNGLIMPIFLWHSTVMMLLIGALFWLLPDLLGHLPGTADWWMMRPVWVLVYALVLAIALPAFIKMEKIVTARARHNVAWYRLASGTFLIAAGLALLAQHGVVGNGAFGINWLAGSLPLFGGLIALIRLPKFRRATENATDRFSN